MPEIIIRNRIQLPDKYEILTSKIISDYLNTDVIFIEKENKKTSKNTRYKNWK